jgi:hypothetical protein
MPDLNEIRLQSEQRHKFYDRILSTPRNTPAKALPLVCEAWKELTDALFVWLWLYNDAAKQWEVTAFAPSGNEIFAPESLTPIKDGGHESVVEYANLFKEPVFIGDHTWSIDRAGKHFRVVASLELTRLGCSSFLCVPLLLPDGYNESLQLRAAVCIHLKSKEPVVQPDESLLLMGRLSAGRIADSYQSEQQTILSQLNVLAEKYLTKRSRYPEHQRREYCEDIINLLRNHLGVKWVSIFYKNESQEMVRCIATTGLWNREGISINRKSPSDASYQLFDGLTGGVFATSIPFISQIGNKSQRPERFLKYTFRETPEEVNESDLPWIIYPIQLPENLGQKGNALGVIRCVGNSPRFGKEQARNFDPIQIQTLSFIARQLAPVLETMAVHIERERSVTIIKHDLFAPLRMIKDEVTEISECIEAGQPIRDYSLPNLAACTMIAKNLVDGLDADPEEALRNFEPRATGLEGDIVARVRNMLSHYAWRAKRIKIVFEPFRETFPKLYIDPNQTERVFCNLILNAVKYGKRGSTIQVVARSEPNWLSLDVVNEGIGVDEKEEKLIFQGRYRGAKAKLSGQSGLGLGLKISRAAMEKQQGRLLLTSGKKEYTVFTMQFPGRLIVQARDSKQEKHG